MKRIIYLDNSATTKPCDRAVEYMNNALRSCWGNPSSLHGLGVKAEKVMNSARETVAGYIKSLPQEIIFTGSGTEANNTAIMSAASRSWGNRVVTTEIEHPSVLETVKRLEKSGFEVIKLKPSAEGKISVEDLAGVLNDKTVLVSIMLVNNEIGSVQPIRQAVECVRKHAPRALFHCDAVQAFGKVPINVKDLGVDLLTASGHKVHAPKGIGFLYCRRGVSIPPFITGGGQERGMRSGTEPVALAAAFEGAVKDLDDNGRDKIKKAEALREYALRKFRASDFIKINSPEDASPYIINISVPGFRSETMLHFLEQENIFVSSGSACAKGEASHVLKAIKLSKMDAESALRISFSNENTEDDIDELLKMLKAATGKLRRFMG